MATNNNNREKEVLIKVKTDTSESSKSLDELRSKIKSTSGTAREMDRLDYGKLSVKDLKKELDKAEMSMEQLAKSGNATDATLKVIGQRVDTINNSLKEIKTDKAYEVFRGQVRGATGAVLAMEGAMSALGIESKSFEQTVQTIIGLRAFRRGLDDVIKYRKEMSSLISVTSATSKATNVLRLSLSALGIGLLVSAVSYLTENWDSFKQSILETFPELNRLGGWFSNIRPIMMGVGNAVVQFVIQPIRSLVDAIKALTQGEFKKAGESIIDAFNPVKRYKDVVSSFKKGYADEIVRANAEKDKKVEDSVNNRVNATSKAVDKSKEAEEKAYQELARYIEEAERDILRTQIEAREFDLRDVRAKYAERIALAEELGEDTTALLEAQRLAEEAINEKYDQIELDNAEKLAKEKLEVERNTKQEALTSATLQGDTNVLNAENIDDGSVASVNRLTEARLEALRMRYEAEQALYADDKDKLANLSAKYENDRNKIEEEGAESRKKIAEAEKEAKLATYDAVGAGLGTLSALAGESTVAGKALGVASATIDTYVGANKALAQGGFAGIAMAASVIGTGLMNVKKILSTKVEGAKNSSRGTSNTPRQAPPAPVINTTILNRPEEVTDLDSLASKPQPIRAYIVDKDLEKSADKMDLTEQLSTF